MAGSKSDYLENLVLDHIFNGTAWSAPANVWVALYTVAPTDSTAGTEVTGGSYARVSTAAADWTAASGGSLNNGNAVTFPAPTANWGTVVAFAIVDASSGAANIYYWGDLTASRVINSGDGAPSFAAAALVISET